MLIQSQEESVIQLSKVLEENAPLQEKIIKQKQEYSDLLHRDSEQKFGHLESEMVKLQWNTKLLEAKLENVEVQ